MKFYNKIPTYIINLINSRSDRKESVLEEFRSKSEFSIRVFEAIQHPIGSIGLWKTIKEIIAIAGNKSLEYILICEDDHQFTIRIIPL